MQRYRFSKKERLSHKKLWEAVFEKGTRLKAFPLMLYYLRTPLPEKVPAQAGFAVPKKSFKKAVSRNQLKRLMREAYRLEKPGIFNNMQGNYAFVFLYLGKEPTDFTDISQAMKAVLTKFKLHEEDTEN
ncbi:MAG: ribonuclease P protein component [Robiginitalea sp.]|jgi:ribonuclease P protein component